MDGDWLAVHIVDAEDHQLAIDEPVRIPPDSRRVTAFSPHAPVYVDRSRALPAMHVGGLEPGVCFGDDSRDLIDQVQAVALGHVRKRCKIEAGGGPLRGLTMTPACV